jgi:co-chaperonin GroES (HSP10)
MPKLKPLKDYLLVTPYRRETQWAGKILLPEKNRDILMGDDHVFWVVAVGTQVKDIQVKDRVVCQFDHDGLEMLVDGSKRGFIRRSQVLAVLPFEQFSEPAP